MAMKVPVSFKKDEKEMYDFLQKQLSPSIYIKQLIQREMENEERKEPLKKQPHVQDILNF